MRQAQAFRRFGRIRDLREQPWLAFLVMSFALIGFGPRIPLDVYVPGRTFDLRLADVALALALPVWVVSRRQSILNVPLSRPIFAYLLIALASTIVAVLTLNLNLLRGLLYWGKEVEYFAFFFIAATTIRTRRQLDTAALALIVVALVNVLWIVAQLLTRHDQSLLSAEVLLPTDVFVNPNRNESYGPHLVGEGSPFSTGGFFTLSVLLSASLMTIRTASRYWASIVIGALCFAGLILSQSRVTLVATVIGAIALLVGLAGNRRRALAGLVILSVAGYLLAFASTAQFRPQDVTTATPSPSLTPPLSPSPTATNVAIESPSPTASAPLSVPPVALPDIITEPIDKALSSGVGRRLSTSAIEYSIAQRLEIWRPLWDIAQRRPLIGYGKGSIGEIPGLGAGEAHMQYLRVFVETGVVGLVAFVAILIVLGRICLMQLRPSTRKSSYLAPWCLSALVAMTICALVQDAFVPVILAELFWISAGLAVAEARLSSAPTQPTSGWPAES